MSRIEKLWRSVTTNSQSIAYRDLEKLLRAFGFRLDRASGSHQIWVHDRVNRPFPIQPRGGEAKGYQVRQFVTLVELHGLTMEDGE